MSFSVAINPANLEFTVNDEQTVLAAALAANINLPHGCKNGSCGECKCKLTNGQVIHEAYDAGTLSAEEQDNNYILLCKAHPQSNIELEIPGFTNQIPIKTLPAKIEAIDKIGTVAILTLKLPARQEFKFYAGQYIDIMYEGKNRSYSLANSPTINNSVELHIRYRQGGVFSEAVWNQLQVGQILRFKGPMGAFTLQNSQKPILMVATGTGFAPLKAILQYMQAEQNTRPVYLVWGNYVACDFYYTELLDQLSQELNLQVQLCVNEGSEGNYYTGLVTDYVSHHFPNLSDFEVYACGNPGMIEGLYHLATEQLQLDPANFFSDVFTPSK